jgi:hypothetical protein
MSPLATYSFLPWLRQGLANQITAGDFDHNVKLRPTVQVQLQLGGQKVGGGTQTETVTRDIALFSAGDILGIDSRAVVRVEPRNWITNFEPNYLAHIEFYPEDFVWRYTPAGPDMAKGRQRPWIMLVVLEESEFSEGKDIRNKPLPYVEVPDLSVFPPADQLWAWAHVHVNRSLSATDDEIFSTDMGTVLPKMQSVLSENPDLAYSRLMCPRKLAENTAYHAFLMPVFETGRLSGLGLDPATSPDATFSAWGTYPTGSRAESERFPYYFRWYFRTATTGDFESLVRLLQPKPVDKRVGTRNMDVQAPGSNLPGITDPALKGILKLGGALRVPREDFNPQELVEVDKYEQWAEPDPRPFQVALASLIDLADDYAQQAAPDANSGSGLGALVENDPDPLITPPLYGTWHALTKRLLMDRDGNPLSPNNNWVHELNLDPRFRVGAGFGTRVVQDQQEKYMDSAWEQIGRVLEANQRIRFGQLGKAASSAWYQRQIQPLQEVSGQKALLLTAPVSKRVLASEVTVNSLLRESLVQPAMMSAAFRRIIRPRGRLLHTLPFTDTVRPDGLLNRVNAGEVSCAPPRVPPSGLTTMDEVAEQLLPRDAPRFVIYLIRRFRWLRWIPLLIALVVAVLLLLLAPPVWLVLAAAVAGAALVAFRRVSQWTAAVRRADGIREEGQTPGSVDFLPSSSDFVLTELGSGFTPQMGETDSVEAVRFKEALKQSYALLQASAQAGAIPVRKALDLTAITDAMIAAIHPDRTIPKRVMSTIFLPARLWKELGEGFVEVMAYPEFDTPMYEPLKNISTELFLPNINLIEQNSITLVETNQAFIESYMVGLNHEFARELLWREFPTDQRGSYFRQFWDVRGFFNSENLDEEALKEKLRDIPPLHKWSRSSKLGDHDNREQPGEKEEELVLVIRGELLKRYPTAVIYAHRACWQRKGDSSEDPCQRSGGIDNKKERLLVSLTPAEEANPPRSKVRTPLYEAKVEPDTYFFGFDLTGEEAKGGTGEHPNDNPGWFFVMKERPGEARFGLDIDKASKLNVWNDLSWADIQPGPASSYIQITATTPAHNVVAPSGPEAQEKLEQYQDDQNIHWNKDMSSADLAYMLFQAPVLVAVHASDMLSGK